MHTYLVTEVHYGGKSIQLDNTLKNHKGEATSEANHLSNLAFMTNKVNWRSSHTIQHSKIERKLRKSIAKVANPKFENVLAAHIGG